jgi:glycerophosphoryl diester phosphodiesterase
MPPEPVLGIAHAYGDRRARIEAALTSGVPVIEVDVRWSNGRVWVRHEHRLGFLPILYNHGLRGIHREGPFAFSLGSLWFRLDVRKLPFREVLDRVSGHTGLLVDLKAARYSRSIARGFVATVLTEIEDARFPGATGFCGSWQLLDIVRALKPSQAVYYAVDKPADWKRMQPRIASGSWPGGVSLRADLLTGERVAALRGAGLTIYAWDIQTPEELARALHAGARGIIADDLDMLAGLRGVAVDGEDRR